MRIAAICGPCLNDLPCASGRICGTLRPIRSPIEPACRYEPWRNASTAFQVAFIAFGLGWAQSRPAVDARPAMTCEQMQVSIIDGPMVRAIWRRMANIRKFHVGYLMAYGLVIKLPIFSSACRSENLQ
jgi:hypothetical protein